MLRRTCHRLIVATGEVTTEQTYGITSLSRAEVSLADLERLWRGHWTIENAVHYVRDETFGEDRCRLQVGSAPQALAALRNGLLSLLRHQGWCNMADALRTYGASVHEVLHLVGALTT